MKSLQTATVIKWVTVVVMMGSLWASVDALVGIGWDHTWWDLRVYMRAADDALAHRDAYRSDVPYMFVYHPHVLSALAWLAKLVSLQWGLISVIGGALLIFIGEFIQLGGAEDSRVPESGARPSAWWLLAAVAVFGTIGWGALASGNVALLWHLLLLAAVMRALRKPGDAQIRLAFCLILVCAVVCKPYFLSYLLLMFALFPGRSALGWAAAVVVACAVIWGSAAWLQPEAFQRFHEALKTQTLGRSDYGFGLVAILHKRTGVMPAALLHVLAVLAFGGWLLWAQRRAGGWQWHAATLSLAVMVVILVNPRAKEYDIWAAVLFGLAYLRQTSPGKLFWVILAGMVAAGLPVIARILDAWHGPHLADILRVNNYMQTLGVLFLMAIVALVSRFEPLPQRGAMRLT